MEGSIDVKPIRDSLSLAQEISAFFEELPANCPISFFGLLRIFGFEKESQLIDSLHKLAQAGQILVSDTADGIALHSIVRPTKLIVGISSAADAKRVFGKPIDSIVDGDRKRLLFSFLPVVLSKLAGDEPSVAKADFELLFGEDGCLISIRSAPF